LARRTLNSKVEDRDIDVMELSAEAVGRFDVVLFLGVLYHLRHPLLALERVASVTADHLIMDTRTDMLFHAAPAIAFYPGSELEADATNWCGPNLPALTSMLRSVGFERVEVIYQWSLPERIARAVTRFIRHGESPIRLVQQGKVVIHAWKS
jgi:tRNA (mo5U34)-methyltransferase